MNTCYYMMTSSPAPLWSLSTRLSNLKDQRGMSHGHMIVGDVTQLLWRTMILSSSIAESLSSLIIFLGEIWHFYHKLIDRWSWMPIKYLFFLTFLCRGVSLETQCFHQSKCCNLNGQATRHQFHNRQWVGCVDPRFVIGNKNKHRNMERSVMV